VLSVELAHRGLWHRRPPGGQNIARRAGV